MCICINCKHINNCKTYHFIETQHKIKEQKNNYNTFIPSNTLIQINLKKLFNKHHLDWDLAECLSFSERPGSWLIK